LGRAWRAIATETIQAGVIEVALSGGEPLLRRDLAHELISEFSSAGVTINLTTSGWFLDDTFADQLARLRAVRVLVSLDGATPAIHDSIRGVPGSWGRAVRAIDALLCREVPVTVNHVVVPRNIDHVEDFLESMWLLGVRSVRLTPVGLVGAAARGGNWEISERRLRRIVVAARERYGDELSIVRVEMRAMEPVERTPTFLLIRPDGTAMLDSLHPFGFGNVVTDGLLGAWKALGEQWNAPAVRSWRATRRGRRAQFVPYRDPELSPISGQPIVEAAGPSPDTTRLPLPTEPRGPSADGAELIRLAMSRRYRVGEVAVSRANRGRHVVQVLDRRRALRVNSTAATAIGARGSQIDAATVMQRIAQSNPDVPESTLRRDVLGLMRRLHARGVLIPEPAARSGDGNQVAFG